jgi:HD-like signal output (HDOD) protein
MVFIIAILIIIIIIGYSLLKPNKVKTPTTKIAKFTTLSMQTQQTPRIRDNKNLSPEPSNNIPPAKLRTFRLIKKDECDQGIVKQILKITQSIPRPHPMLRALTKEMDDAEKLYQLVKSDPEIAAKILQAVNSAGMYLTQKITRLNHAILYLGTNMVKNIAMQCVINTQAQPTDKQVSLAFKKIWANGFLASSLTFLFAKNLGLNNAPELSTQALLAYIGNLAIISYKPQLASYFSQPLSLLDRIQMEQKELGAHSAIIGSELALTWQLPQEILMGIQDNLVPLAIPPSLCELKIDYLRDIVLCYLCCRLAEVIIDNEVHDIAEINILDNERIELFYLPEYIRITGLQSLLTLQHKPDFRKEANKMIQKIESPKPKNKH